MSARLMVSTALLEQCLFGDAPVTIRAAATAAFPDGAVLPAFVELVIDSPMLPAGAAEVECVIHEARRRVEFRAVEQDGETPLQRVLGASRAKRDAP